jgi:hypothetical protein
MVERSLQLSRVAALAVASGRALAYHRAMQPFPELQYPIGRFVLPSKVSAEDRSMAIDTLAAIPQQLCAALDGLADSQLDAAYRPGGWSIRRLVHHIADSDMTAYSWMRLALTEDWPTVFAYDPAALANLADSTLSPEVSLRLIEALHSRWVSTLRAVPDRDWATRGYVHPESGRCSLEQTLAMYAWHSRHHLAHIVLCRESHRWVTAKPR